MTKQTITLAEFRELTEDVPGDWPLVLSVRDDDETFTESPVDASVDFTGRRVTVSDDTHVSRPAA